MKLIRFGVPLVLAFFTVLNSSGAAPAAPGNARPAWVDDFSVVLTWDEVPEADSFSVYRFDAANSQWVGVGSGLLVPMFREVPPHQPPLQYAITALNADGESAATVVSLDQAGWPMTTITLTPIDSSWGTLTETNAVINFAASIMAGTDGLLEIGTDTANLEFYEYQGEYASWHNYIVTNLSPGTEYFYRLTISEPSRLGMTYVSSFVTMPMNQPPVANDVTVQQAGEGETAISLTGSDPDYWQWLTLTITTPPVKGTITALYQTGQGSWTAHYQPHAGARGTDFFQFVVSDEQIQSAPATATITGIFMNGAPLATDAQIETAEDVTVGVTLQGNDPDGDPLNYVVVDVSEGSVAGTAPALSWTPPADFSGTSFITFQVSDGYAQSYGTVQITVTPVNDAPVGTNVTVSTFEDTEVQVPLSAADAEAEAVTFTLVRTPDNGSVGSIENGSVSYIPDSNFNGLDSFDVQVSDGTATGNTFTVTVEILAANDAPLATHVMEEGTEDLPVPVVLGGSDVDGDALTFEILSQPEHGTLSGVAPNLVYSPAANFNGVDGFTYRVSDGTTESEIASVIVDIALVNDAPVGVSSSVSTLEDTAALCLFQASDIDRDAVSFAVVSQPSNGILSAIDGSSVAYTPNANFHGTDSFEAVVNDGVTDGNVFTVIVSVAPVNDAPSASDASVTTDYNTAIPLSLAGSDLEGSALTSSVVSGPSNGTLSGTAPSLTFTPAIGWSGTTSFAFTVSDGELISALATVYVTVAPPASTPLAPSKLAALAVSTSRINLTWSDNSTNEDGFRIEQYYSGTWSVVGTVGPDAQSFSSTGLNPNRNYSFRVRAFNVLGNSAYSNTASAKTRK